MKRYTFTVTAGHGGKDPGAVSGEYTEAGLMTDLRNKVAAELRARGHTVKQDGDALLNWPLIEAISLVTGSAVAVDLHTNASSNPVAGGVEVVSLPSKRRGAQLLARAIASVLGNRLRHAQGWVDQNDTPRKKLGYVGAGGYVVETFFITNPIELRDFLNRIDEVAVALADAMEQVASGL
jgi:N-acetylmuramoyl-L-alanine amidase